LVRTRTYVEVSIAPAFHLHLQWEPTGTPVPSTGQWL